MTRRLGMIAATVLITLLLNVVLLELVLRVLSRTDADGNVWVAGKARIRPFRPPIEEVRPKVERILSDPELYFTYDAKLGWTLRPNATADEGRYSTNAQRIRTDSRQLPTAPRPAPGTLRIATYGDSFTHSSDVGFEDSWGFVLQARLDEAGLAAEVLNQGTPGYAMDQAYLRWREQGRPLAPDVVVFGFQSSNARRNLNLLRVLYSPDTGLVFSKPRFVLEGQGLRLVNVPALPPDRILDVLSSFEGWELAPYEFFYRPENYAESPWYASRLAAFVSSGLGTRFSQRRTDVDFFAEGSESREIVWRLVERFEREVRADGARFVILHIPTGKHIERLREGEPLAYQSLFDQLVERYDVVDPGAALVRAAEEHGMKAMFAPDSGHFSGVANTAIGEVLAEALQARVRSDWQP
ncbi:MAG: SGNH/GDSL hydrolase family protein [Myxococcota bacterium]|nr:SGNH/GDSL hydrolase family protein [Myxococcota bacterium]